MTESCTSEHAKGRRSPKKLHRFGKHQTELMCRHYWKIPKNRWPNKRIRGAFAKRFKVQERKVQVWFQNQRAKFGHTKKNIPQTLEPCAGTKPLGILGKRQRCFAVSDEAIGSDFENDSDSSTSKDSSDSSDSESSKRDVIAEELEEIERMSKRQCLTKYDDNDGVSDCPDDTMSVDRPPSRTGEINECLTGEFDTNMDVKTECDPTDQIKVKIEELGNSMEGDSRMQCSRSTSPVVLKEEPEEVDGDFSVKNEHATFDCDEYYLSNTMSESFKDDSLPPSPTRRSSRILRRMRKHLRNDKGQHELVFGEDVSSVDDFIVALPDVSSPSIALPVLSPFQWYRQHEEAFTPPNMMVCNQFGPFPLMSSTSSLSYQNHHDLLSHNNPQNVSISHHDVSGCSLSLMHPSLQLGNQHQHHHYCDRNRNLVDLKEETPDIAANLWSLMQRA